MASVEQPPPPPTPETKPVESHRERTLRLGRRARLYALAILVVGLVAVLAVLISRNNRSAKLDWVFGSTHASLVWIILAAAVLGWLLGIATGAVFHRRTRTPR